MFHADENILYSSVGKGFAVTDILSPNIEKSFLYWREKSEGCGQNIPPISVFDPVQIADLLTNCLLIGLEGCFPDVKIKIRVMGTALVDGYGFEGSNRYLEECVDKASYDCFKGNLRHVVTEEKPVLMCKSLPGNQDGFYASETIYLPFRCAEGGVGRVLAVAEFLDGYPH